MRTAWVSRSLARLMGHKLRPTTMLAMLEGPNQAGWSNLHARPVHEAYGRPVGRDTEHERQCSLLQLPTASGQMGGRRAAAGGKQRQNAHLHPRLPASL